MEAHEEVHGIIRKQPHGGVHDMTCKRVHWEVQGRVRALLAHWFQGYKQATATSLPQESQHLALLQLCNTQDTGALKELTNI